MIINTVISKWTILVILIGLTVMVFGRPQYQDDFDEMQQNQLNFRDLVEGLLQIRENKRARLAAYDNEDQDSFAMRESSRREEDDLSIGKRCIAHNGYCAWWVGTCCGSNIWCTNSAFGGRCQCGQGFTLNYEGTDCVSAG